MKDYLLTEFSKRERWDRVVSTGIVKDINKKVLRDIKDVETRQNIVEAIYNEQYCICPPHQAEIPKDDGTMRIVYVNEDVDRLVLSILNDMLFEFCPEMVHHQCKSYQKGIGCGKTVSDSVESVMKLFKYGGFKADLSKYFDSVPIKYIDGIFDNVEAKCGKSHLINVARRYYHQDLCFDPKGNLISHYQSLKQGCAVASFLADAVLKHIDDKMCNLNGYYVRYSDDIIFIGKDWRKAKRLLETELKKMGMKLNPKKVENISQNKWFKFLGFNIMGKGNLITLSKKRWKNLENRLFNLVKNCHSAKSAMNKINRYLYQGEYPWATGVLAIVNCEKDLITFDNWIKDLIRLAEFNPKGNIIKKDDIGGVGNLMDKNFDYTLSLGKGNKVGNARKRMSEIKGYKSLMCMRNALIQGRNVYDAIVLNMHNHNVKQIETENMSSEECLIRLDELYEIYKTSVPSENTERRHTYFKALDVDDLTTKQMCLNERRETAQRNLEQFLFSCIHNRTLVWDESWGSYYHCMSDRDFVLLKDWFK